MILANMRHLGFELPSLLPESRQNDGILNGSFRAAHAEKCTGHRNQQRLHLHTVGRKWMDISFATWRHAPAKAHSFKALPTTPEAAESDERPSVQELVQKYEAKPEEDEEEAAAARARRIQQAPMPTLLRRSVEGPKPGLSAGQDEQSPSPEKLPASPNDEACGTPPLMSDQELQSKSNALRRKGFNNLPRKPSHDCWDVLQPVALV
ncbi:unnamed protein product [Symbiodinium microadriaticum]|nr:unnamed protein product [Symbiodinium microadriaticum]